MLNASESSSAEYAAVSGGDTGYCYVAGVGAVWAE